MGHHQHLTRTRVGHNAGDEPGGIELGSQHAALFDVFAGAGHGKKRDRLGQARLDIVGRDKASAGATAAARMDAGMLIYS